MTIPPAPEVVLELFVQGQAPQSTAALDLVHRMCEEHLSGRYRLDVIDIQQQPERTREANVIAAPALIRRRPQPVVRTFGHLSEARARRVLGIPRSENDPVRS